MNDCAGMSDTAIVVEISRRIDGSQPQVASTRPHAILVEADRRHIASQQRRDVYVRQLVVEAEVGAEPVQHKNCETFGMRAVLSDPRWEHAEVAELQLHVWTALEKRRGQSQDGSQFQDLPWYGSS